MRFKDKVAVVTGGGSGIGRATALALGHEGAAVVIGNRNAKQGQSAVREIEDAGGKASYLRTDVSLSDDVRALVGHAVKTFGKLDLAFNNAGSDGEQRLLHEQDDAKSVDLFNVNVQGVFLAMKYEIEAMLRNPGGEGRGSIVNCGSVLGLKGYPHFSLYVGTKHAITGMSKAAALEYAKQGIRINVVAPGPIATPLLAHSAGGDPQAFARAVPMGRIGRPEEVAAAVLWLLSADASFITGHTLAVDGGYCAR